MVLAQLKRHWRVAMSALLMRAKQLNCITPSDERALQAQISRNGWRKRESPELDVCGESPGDRYAELISLYREHLGYSIDDLATVVNLSRTDLIERVLPAQQGLRRVV